MPKPVEPDGQWLSRAYLGLGFGKTSNVFAIDPAPGSDTSEMGLSDQGRHFLGGIMSHAMGLAAITNPTVNSYKRLNAATTASGATWAPNTVTWTGNNRTHMVRPRSGAVRAAPSDGAANPYLLQAAIIAAGLSGLAAQADPGPRRDINMYTEGHTLTDAVKLPLNMLGAMRAFDADSALKTAIGAAFSTAYVKMKLQEWDAFMAHLSEWERETTLDI